MKIRILGLGNVLMSDDGFGPYVARVIEAFYDVPDGVQVIDAGPPGLDLTTFLLDADAVILIDTVSARGTAGDIHSWQMSEILLNVPESSSSLHAQELAKALLTAAASGAGPKHVLLLGVVPEWVATGVSLSRAVRSAIAPVIGLVVTELDRLGTRLRLRPVPREPDTWWERGARSELAGAVR